MGTYAYTGQEMSITIGTATYRSYQWSWGDNVSRINAPAFEDAVGVNATVVTAIEPTITIQFRHNILDALDYDTTYSIAFVIGTDFDKTLTCTLADKGGSGSKEGIADFTATFAVQSMVDTPVTP